MRTTSRIIRAIAMLGAVAAVTIGSAQAQRNTVTPVSQMKMASGPQPGDCKGNYEMVFAANPAMAQQIWQASVASKFGNKWAHWVGAKNKSIVPQATSSGTQFRAMAKPCFYHPVP